MKKNVLMVGAYPPNQTGGGEFQLQTLSKMLDKRGYDVSVLSMGTRNFEIDNDGGVKIYRVGKFQRDRRGSLKLLQVLKYITVEIFNPLLFIFTIYLILKNRIKTVHITTYNQISLAPLLASKILMRNVVLTMHGHELLCSHSTIMPFCYGIRKGQCGTCMLQYHKIPKALEKFKGVKEALLVFYNLFTSLIISLKFHLTNHLASTIVFPSNYLKKLYTGYGIEKKKAKVIPCFLDESEPQIGIAGELRRKFKPKGEKVILYVGKVIEEKGIKVLLESFEELLKIYKSNRGNRSNKKLKLLVVGHGRSFQKIRKFANKLKISKYVKFVGSVPHHYIFSYYQISDIVVIPSIVPETFSIALSEASLSKKIIVCSRIGALEDRIHDGENGFLVEPNDPKELAEKISYALSNTNKLRRLGESAYNNYNHKYKSGRSFSQYLKLFGFG